MENGKCISEKDLLFLSLWKLPDWPSYAVTSDGFACFMRVVVQMKEPTLGQLSRPDSAT